MITAVVKNAANSALPATAITFGASSGALQGAPTVTDDKGVATVTLNPGTDRSNRTITVTARSGSAVSTIDVPVVGTKLSVVGAGSLVQSTTARSSYTVRALDSAGNAVPNVALQVQSSLGNPLGSASVVTDAAGFAQIDYTPVTNGIDTLSINGLGTSAQTSISVSGKEFTFTSPSAGTSVPTSLSQQVTVRLREAGIDLAGQIVTFSTTRGTLTPATAITDASGNATVTLLSSTAGSATITAITGTTRASQTFEFVAVVPASLVLQANPGAVLPNASGSTANRSTLLATVRDSFGNPVKSAAISFSASDPSGGSISPAIALTDANGQAQSSFIPGGLSTATQGVVVTATVQSSPQITGTARLTVNGSALFITIGTGNELLVPNTTTYSKPFSVYVTDAVGAPLRSQPVILSVYSNRYSKGSYSVPTTVGPTGTVTRGDRWVPTLAASCANEDLNANGILDGGEDVDGNGRLTPGGVVLISPTTVTTDASGFATFNVLYGKQYAIWIDATITARATVAGTESSSTYGPFTLPVLASDVTNVDVSPPNQVSPFGVSSSCTNAQ